MSEKNKMLEAAREEFETWSEAELEARVNLQQRRKDYEQICSKRELALQRLLIIVDQIVNG